MEHFLHCIFNYSDDLDYFYVFKFILLTPIVILFNGCISEYHLLNTYYNLLQLYQWATFDKPLAPDVTASMQLRALLPN